MSAPYPGSTLDLNSLDRIENKTFAFCSWRGANNNEAVTISNGPSGNPDLTIGFLVEMAGGRNGYGLNMLQILNAPASKKIYFRTRTGFNAIGFSEWKEL